MQLPLQISFREMEASPAVEARIRQKAARLDRFFPHIMACRVVVEAPHRHHREGKLYQVRVDLTVPGGEITASRTGPMDHAHEDLRAAIRDAFDAATRQLQDHVRRLRGMVKTHEEPLQGRVARLFPAEGYGFVVLPDGQEVYFHRNSVIDGGFAGLEAGRAVRLVVAEGESAQGPQATTVQPVRRLSVGG